MLRIIGFAVVIFAAYSAYHEFFATSKDYETGPSIQPEYEAAIYKARSDLEAIYSGISRDVKRNKYSGKDPYPKTLTNDADHLFGNVLITPIYPSKKGWQWQGQNHYTYTYGPGKSVSFEYSPRDGKLYCRSDYEICQFF